MNAPETGFVALLTLVATGLYGYVAAVVASIWIA